MGAQNAALLVAPDGRLDLERVKAEAKAFPGLVGMDLVPEVTARQRYGWREGLWELGQGYVEGPADGPHIVALDYGIKRNILRNLACRRLPRDGGPGHEHGRGGAGARA